MLCFIFLLLEKSFSFSFIFYKYLAVWICSKMKKVPLLREIFAFQHLSKSHLFLYCNTLLW